MEVVMKIKLSTESTGLAYFPGLAEPTTIDVQDLPKDQADQFERLIEDASFFDQPSQGEASRGLVPDAQQYTLTVEDGKRSHSVQLSDPVSDPALQALLTRVQAQAREQRTADWEKRSQSGAKKGSKPAKK